MYASDEISRLGLNLEAVGHGFKPIASRIWKLQQYGIKLLQFNLFIAGKENPKQASKTWNLTKLQLRSDDIFWKYSRKMSANLMSFFR